MTNRASNEPDAVSHKEARHEKRPELAQNAGNADTTPYRILTHFLTFPDEAQKRWWEDSGSLLSRFLHVVRYDAHNQYATLLFLYKNLLPFTGPYPQPRRYMLQPYGAPMEYSINFQENKKEVLRIALEPVSALYGTKDDPYNLKTVTKFESTLGQISPKDHNRDLYKHFANELLVSKKEMEELYQRDTNSDPDAVIATGVWGFVFREGGDVTIKGYINILLKAKAIGASPRERLNKSLQNLNSVVDYSGSLKLVQEYMMEGSSNTGELLVSWDYGPPETSRIKIYGAVVENASPATIREVWTLGGRVNTESSRKGLELAIKLWELLHTQTESPPINRKRQYLMHGMIWHYEVWPGAQYPVPKIYLPTAGTNDENIAEAISRFFYSLGWKERAELYPKMAKEIFLDVDLSQSSRLHTWISFSYTEQGGAYSTVYYQGAMRSAEF
ncbi:tryptophan dimethylallyltransferase-domain-containing protein [Aspergillus floccosus]